ncbi:MAG: hypothetical protein PHX08_04450 [Lachnospiraceae bacterium]|nr:hypothetical protein [Lachnospiraceae bacterium]
MNKKRTYMFILAVIIIIILISTIFMVHGFKNDNDKYVKPAQEGSITRYEWMKMLCEETGMTESRNESPYFSDVEKDNSCFTYLQSAVEWDVLNTDSKFEGDKYAYGKFIALTIMKTMGEDKIQLYLETEKKITDKEYLKLAIDKELIEKDKLNRAFSKEECEKVLEKFNNLYFGEFWKRDISNVTYKDGVVEVSADSIENHNDDYSEVLITDEISTNLSKGDIIVIEQQNTGIKMARQISEIKPDGMLILINTDVESVLESLVVSDISEVSFEDIVSYYNLKENSQDSNFVQMRNGMNDSYIISTWESKSKGFKISLETKEEDTSNLIEVNVTDNNTGATYTLPINAPIEKNSSYYAEVDIDKINVASQIKYQSSTGVEYADVALDSHATFGGGIKKELDEKNNQNKFLLCKTPVPLGNGLVAVDVEIYLVVLAEGSIKIQAEMPMQVSVRYEKDKGIRNISNDVSVEKPVIEANCKASTMLRAEPTLIILSCLNVMDAEADIGAVVEAKALLHTDSQFCVDASSSYPVLTVSVCGDEEKDTLIRKIGLKAEWKIITSENAPHHISLHYEILQDGTSQFVDKCTYVETPVKEEIVKEGWSTYQTRFGEVEAVECPMFWFDYPTNWQITKEEVYGGDPANLLGEEVVISNDRGVSITYMDFNYGRSELSDAVNYGRIAINYDVSKIADAEFTPTYPSGTDSDYSNQGKFIVGKIKATGEIQMDEDSDFIETDGRVFYALMPESYIGAHDWVRGIQGYYDEFSFDYPSPYALFAESPDGQFTDKEEKEIIAILGSFRDEQ